MKHFFCVIYLIIACPALLAQPISFTSKGIGGGGALFSPSINPANNQEFYLSCDMTELFHSTDFGSTYKQVSFQNFIGGHDSKVNFTSPAGLLFSISYVNDIGTPVKSTDNGVTWTPLEGNPGPDENKYSLVVDYANPSRVILSNYKQLYFSSNGGNTFTLIHSALISGSGIVVAGTFFDGNNIYIGTNDGVLTSGNGGTNWAMSTITGLPVNERIWSFTAAKQNGTTRFFCLTGNVNNVYAGMPGSDYWNFFKGIYSYDLGTGGWIAKVGGISPGTDFPMFIKMAANDINTVYIAGSNSSSEPIVMKSVNAGTQWNHTFMKSNNQNIKTGWSGQGGDRGWSYGECPFGFEVASNNANVLIFTDFGFCHKTDDGGATWAQAYVNKANENAANTIIPAKKSYESIGLENTTNWQIHWTNANEMWACYSDIRGLRSTDGGNKWSFNYSGIPANSTYRVAQGTDGKLFAATSNIHDMYQSTRLQDNILDANDTQGKIIYSSDKGLIWQDLHVFNHPVFWITIDPNNANRAYASVIHYGNGTGTGGVYRCDNLSSLASSTWTLLPNPPRTEKHPASLTVLNDGTLVASYSGRRTSTSFTASSGVFIYSPTSNSWSDVSHSGMYYWTKDVVIDPNDVNQNTWYAGVFSGWGGAPNGLGGLYKTINRGASWTKLTGSVLDRVTSCTFNPLNANELYITTEAQGLWMSKNINAATPEFTLVSSYPFRQPERVFFNPFNTNQMWVSSFGNGMKMGMMDNTPLPVTLTDFTAVASENSILLQWETVEEKEFDRFELEKSRNPKKGFTYLATIKPSADTKTGYQFADTDAEPNVNFYYRLKMVDRDGSLAFSKIVVAKLSGENSVLVFPNPSKKQVNITSVTPMTSVVVTNIAGQVIIKESFPETKKYTFSIPGQSNGLFFLTIAGKDGSAVQRKVVFE